MWHWYKDTKRSMKQKREFINTPTYCSQLIFNKVFEANYWRKENLFNKWSQNNYIHVMKKIELISQPHTKNKNLYEVGNTPKCVRQINKPSRRKYGRISSQLWHRQTQDTESTNHKMLISWTSSK